MEVPVYKKLPDIIKRILVIGDGWLVGSAIENLLENKKITDYDIIVNNKSFVLFLSMFKDDVEINHYGGMDFIKDGIKINIWMSSLKKYLKTAKKVSFVFNLKHKIMIKTLDFNSPQVVEESQNEMSKLETTECKHDWEYIDDGARHCLKCTEIELHWTEGWKSATKNAKATIKNYPKSNNFFNPAETEKEGKMESQKPFETGNCYTTECGKPCCRHLNMCKISNYEAEPDGCKLELDSEFDGNLSEVCPSFDCYTYEELLTGSNELIESLSNELYELREKLKQCASAEKQNKEIL